VQPVPRLRAANASRFARPVIPEAISWGCGFSYNSVWNAEMKSMVNDQTPLPANDAQPGDALPQDFETALAELEALAGRMSDGNLGLDESIALYQRGVALARVCQQRLEIAEQQVQVLQGQLLEPLAGTGSQDAS
jgi:exodeoxyribonuclease VII small subunit